ncbi:MAG: hypothetical protein L0Y72_29190 [Gemmataceae bacterium]|nr:hypothetical protein [Gemmataceae bacterium]MCI0743123.1 hypothetical protein [Gemmataceae bacterium]
MFAVFCPLFTGAQEKTAAPLVVLTPGGQELTLKTWTFSAGTRRLSWLEPSALAPSKKAALAGPEHLEFRENQSTAFANGILTLVPVRSVRQILYDADKKSVAIDVVTAGGKEVKLAGSTRFTGVNKFHIDGDADAAQTAVAGPVQLQDGFLKVGIRGYRFPAPEAVAEITGRQAAIVAQDKEKTVHAVAGLAPLYKVGAGYRTLPYLVFQKTVRIDLDKIEHMANLPAKNKKLVSLDFDVTTSDGKKQGLSLLDKISLDEKQSAILVGFVGRVATGYKLFPPHTIAELKSSH